MEPASLHISEYDVASAHLRDGIEAAEAPAVSSPARAAKRPFQSIRRIQSVAKLRESDAEREILEALESEVLLLREENAQLRVKLERAPALGDVVEQMRALTEGGQNSEEAGDHAWHLLAEAVVTRDALVDLCKWTREAMTALERRLQQLEPLEWVASLGAGDSAGNDHPHGHTSLLADAKVATADKGSAVSPVQAVDLGWPPNGNHRPGSDRGHVTEEQSQ